MAGIPESNTLFVEIYEVYQWGQEDDPGGLKNIQFSCLPLTRPYDSDWKVIRLHIGIYKKRGGADDSEKRFNGGINLARICRKG